MPNVTVHDPTLAEVSVSGMDWNLNRAEVRLLRPGAVRLTAELQGDTAEALLASLDPETTSEWVHLPSELPAQAPEHPSEARLMTNATSWKTFVDGVARGSEVAPPIDFADHSLVAVVTTLTPDAGTPVVTHVASEPTPTVTVVVPEIQSKMGVQGDRPGQITLLKIAKVEADTQIKFETLGSER